MKDGKMQKIQLATDIETVEANVADLEKLLGIKPLSVKYEMPARLLCKGNGATNHVAGLQ